MQPTHFPAGILSINQHARRVFPLRQKQRLMGWKVNIPHK